MVFNYTKNLKICFFTILLVLLASSFSSFPINAQSNDNVEIQAGITPDNPILWGLDRAIEKIQLLLTFNQTKKIELRLQIANERLAEIGVMLAKNNTEAAERAEKARVEEIEIIGSLGVDNATKINVTEKPIEEETTNATNITCGYCQYLVNDTCLNYSCCKYDECKTNEYCSKHECVTLECGECQYVEVHSCVSYECCEDEDCGVNQTCVGHVCINTEAKCPSCSAPEISPTTGNTCAYYYCNASTNYFCRREIIKPCCGNNECEISRGENEDNCLADCEGVLEVLYCEYDQECTPCCASGGRGACMHEDYSCGDYPALYSPNFCGKEIQAECAECKCVNNQCVTESTGVFRC